MEFFNLNNMGDQAIVRLLHSSTKTIEKANVHKLMINNKQKSIKCLGNNCPICQTNNLILNRIYIRLFDYTDNKEKVWVRTDKILPQFEEIQNNWGNLSNCVIKITRLTQDFPKYSVDLLNPQQFIMPNLTIDQSCAYQFYMTRSADEINQFMQTGIMPQHQKAPQNNQQNINNSSSFIPKSEYNNQYGNNNYVQPNFSQNQQVNYQQPTQNNYQNNNHNYKQANQNQFNANNNQQFQSQNNSIFMDDPFAFVPRKV